MAQKKAQPDFIPDSAVPGFIPDGMVASDQGFVPQESPNVSFLRQATGAITDMGKGAAKGALNTATGLSEPIHNIPVIGPKLVPEEGLARVKELRTPHGDAQKAGFVGEQAAEYLLPTGIEGKTEQFAAEHAPQIIARIAPRVARIGASALETGARNKLQGGSFKEGAAAGGIGAGVGELARAAAPSVMESALDIPKRMRGYGRTPGLAALEETRGIRPETIEASARNRLGEIGSEINGIAARHDIPPRGTISLRPALGVIDSRAAKAAQENTPGIHGQLGPMRDLLTREFETGSTIPADVTATRALDLKRGLRTQYVHNWNPEIHAEIPGVAKRASRAIDTELDTALGPKFTNLNQRYSSLAPVAERAESLGRDPGLAQRVGRRIAAHTGALIPAAGGFGYGYSRHQDPLEGAAYGLAGLAIPEALSTTPARAAVARTMYSPVARRLIVGGGLQAGRLLKGEQDGGNNDGQ